MRIWLTSLVLSITALFYAASQADAATIIVRANNGFAFRNNVAFRNNLVFNSFAVNRFAFNNSFAVNRFAFNNSFAPSFAVPVASYNYAPSFAVPVASYNYAPSFAVACPTVAAPIAYQAPICEPAYQASAYQAAPVCAPVPAAAGYGVGSYGVGFGAFGVNVNNVGYAAGFNNFFAANRFNTFNGFGNRFVVRIR